MGKSTNSTGDPFAFKPEWNNAVKKTAAPAPEDKAQQDPFAFKPEWNQSVKKNDGVLDSQESQSALPETVSKSYDQYATRNMTGNDVAVLGQTDWGKTNNFNLLNKTEADEYAKAHNAFKLSDLQGAVTSAINEYYPATGNPEKDKARGQILTGIQTGDQNIIINTRNGIVNRLNQQIVDLKKANETTAQITSGSMFAPGLPAQHTSVPKNVQDQIDAINGQIQDVNAVFNEVGINALASSRETSAQIADEANRNKAIPSTAAAAIGNSIQKLYGISNFNDNINYEREKAGLQAIITNKQRRIDDLTVNGYSKANADAIKAANKEKAELATYQNQLSTILDRYPDVATTQTAKFIGDRIARDDPKNWVISKTDVLDAARRIDAENPGFIKKFGKYVDIVAESEGEGMFGQFKPGLVPKGGITGGLETATMQMGYEGAGIIAKRITGNKDKEKAIEAAATAPKLQGTSYSGEVPVKIVYDKNGNAFREADNENYGKISWNSSVRFAGTAIPGLAQWVLAEEATGGLASLAYISAATKAAKVARVVEEVGVANKIALSGETLLRAQNVGKTFGLVGASFATGYDQNHKVAESLIDDQSSLGDAKKTALATFMALTTAGVFKIAGYSPSSFVEKALSKSVASDALALLEKNGWKQPTADEAASFMRDVVLPKVKTVGGQVGQSLSEGAKIGAATVVDQKIKDYAALVISPDKAHPQTAEESVKAFVEQTLFMSVLSLPRAIRSGISSPSTRDSYYDIGLRGPQYIERIRNKMESGDYDTATGNKMISVAKTLSEEVAKVQTQTNADGTPMTLQQKKSIALANFRKRAASELHTEGEAINKDEVHALANNEIEAIREQNKNFNLTDTHAFKTATGENGKKPDSIQEIENNPDRKYKYEDNDGKEVEATGLELLSQIQNSKPYAEPKKAEVPESKDANVPPAEGGPAEANTSEAAQVVHKAIDAGNIKGAYAEVAREKPEEFLSNIADQALGRTADGEPSPHGEAEKAAREQFGDELVDTALKMFPAKAEGETEIVDSNDAIEKQMRPITDKMASIERELSNDGIEVDWDYDNEITVTDKKTGEPIEPGDVPEKSRPLIAEYEKATKALGDFYQPAFVKSLTESRKVEDTEAEIIPNNKTEKNEQAKIGERGTLQSNREESGGVGGNEPGSSSSSSGDQKVREGENGETGKGGEEKVNKIDIEKELESEKNSLIRSGVKFAQELPKIMKEALDFQKPYRDKFLESKGLTYDEFSKLSESDRNKIQQEWVKSEPFEEMEKAHKSKEDISNNKINENEKENGKVAGEKSGGEKSSQSRSEKSSEESGGQGLRQDVKEKEFTTKSGKQKVVRLPSGELSVIDSKTGEKVSKPTERKALKEYADHFDYSKGERAPEPTDDFRTEEDLKKWAVGETKNPAELAAIYMDEEPATPPLSTTEQAIADFGIGKTTTESFDKFDDKNNRGKNLAFSYLDNKTGTPVDEIAREMSDHYGFEITPNDVIDFMKRFPGGAEEAVKLGESDVAVDAASKFHDLTGLKLTKDLAKKVVDKDYENIKAENDKLLNEDHENEQRLTDEYFRQNERPQEEGPAPASKQQVGEETSKPKTAEESVKGWVDAIRGLKSKKDVLQSNIFGVAIPVWDAALETVATALEKGAQLVDAIRAGIDYIKKNNNAPFDENGFSKTIEDIAAGKKPNLKVGVGGEAETIKAQEKVYKANNEKSREGEQNWSFYEDRVDDPIGTYVMSSADESGKYMSGQTIEAARGEESMAPQEYTDMMTLALAGEDASAMVNGVKASWGTDILDSGRKALAYSKQILRGTESLYKKIVLLNGLMKDINTEKHHARVVGDYERLRNLNGLLRDIDIEYQRNIREASKALNAGRLQRLERAIRGQGAGGPEGSVLGTAKVKMRDELLKTIREGEISDKDAVKPVTKTAEEAQRNIDEQTKRYNDAQKEAEKTKQKAKPKKNSIFKDQADQILKDSVPGETDATKAKRSFIDGLKDRFNKLNCP